MKHLFFTLLFFQVIICYTQNYNSPESIDYDSLNSNYYISNSSNGQILKWDGNSLTIFTDNIGFGPHGIEIVNNTIFVCSGSNLLGFDLEDGSQILDYNLNATFLNGITHSNQDLYISDFGDKILYRYNFLKNNIEIISTFEERPNGVCFDEFNNRILVVCWGSNAPIYEVDLINNNHNTLLYSGLGNLDGIAIDDCGYFYVSAWSDNSIYRYSPNFQEVQLVVENLSHPADIFYNKITNTLAIPNSLNNTVNFLNFDFCNNLTLSKHAVIKKKIVKTIDGFGLNISEQSFRLMIDIFDDGSSKKRIILN